MRKKNKTRRQKDPILQLVLGRDGRQQKSRSNFGSILENRIGEIIDCIVEPCGWII
jgi:hypothetical protein